MNFFKINHLGNNFIFLEEFINKEKIIKLCNVNFGIGADGVVVIKDNFMHIFNKDGSEASICGNALICLGKYFNKDSLINTKSGIRKIKVNEFVEVNMDKPHIKKKISDKLYLVNAGNNHLVYIKDDNLDLDIVEFSKNLQNSYKANVNIISDLNKDSFKIETYELGVGSTYACGSGLTASFFVLHELNHVSNKIVAYTKGGNFYAFYEDGNYFIKGLPKIVCKGEILDE